MKRKENVIKEENVTFESSLPFPELVDQLQVAEEDHLHVVHQEQDDRPGKNAA